jgi:hypothetical protein
MEHVMWNRSINWHLVGKNWDCLLAASCRRLGLLRCIVLSMLSMLAICACHPALPRVSAQKEIAEAVDQTEQNVATANRFALQAEAARKESAQMLKEARGYLDQAIKTREVCLRRVKVVTKCSESKSDVTKVPEKRAEQSHLQDVKRPEVKIEPPLPKVAPEPVHSSATGGVIDDDYSPSDRPLSLPPSVPPSVPSGASH